MKTPFGRRIMDDPLNFRQAGAAERGTPLAAIVAAWPTMGL